MLILTRRPGQSIRIADNITVQVLEVRGQMVRIGIDAPADVEIWREELYLNLNDEGGSEARRHGADRSGADHPPRDGTRKIRTP